MTAFACGPAAPWEPDEEPDGYVPCCYGSAARGPSGCTCWEAVYDLEQKEPRVSDRDDVREEACRDCAYRRGSPELADDPDTLRGLVARGSIFWCHQGIRRVVEWRHPDGRRVEAPPMAGGVPGDYRPPIVGARPFKADGSVADVCAGWWERWERQEARA